MARERRIICAREKSTNGTNSKYSFRIVLTILSISETDKMSSVSPVLRTCRWIALPIGYWYGTQRQEELKLIRATERTQEMGKF